MRYYSNCSVSKIKLHQRSLNNLIVSVSVWDCCTTRNVWLKWTHDLTPTVAIKIKCHYKLQLLSLNSVASASTPDNICNSMSLCLLCLCHSFLFHTSVQATGPFLHIGALAAVTALSWIVAGQVTRAEKMSMCASVTQHSSPFLPDVTISHRSNTHIHRRSCEWLTLCRQEAKTSTQGVQDNEHSSGLMWCFPPRTFWIVCPWFQDSLWGSLALNVCSVLTLTATGVCKADT